jgi:hypothetical protein
VLLDSSARSGLRPKGRVAQHGEVDEPSVRLRRSRLPGASPRQPRAPAPRDPRDPFQPDVSENVGFSATSLAKRTARCTSTCREPGGCGERRPAGVAEARHAHAASGRGSPDSENAEYEGLDDPDVLALAASERRILVTGGRAFTLMGGTRSAGPAHRARSGSQAGDELACRVGRLRLREHREELTAGRCEADVVPEEQTPCERRLLVVERRPDAERRALERALEVAEAKGNVVAADRARRRLAEL